MRLRFAFTTTLLALFAACTGKDEPTSIYAAGYDQSCTSDAECALVGGLRANGTECLPLCDGTVNQRDAARMRADVDAELGRCERRASVDCLRLGAMCDRGTCTSYACPNVWGDPSCPAPAHATARP